MNKKRIFLILISVVLTFSCSNPYWKSYYSNLRMRGYIISTTAPIYYLGKDGFPLLYPYYLFVPEKYVIEDRRNKTKTLTFKKNPVIFDLEIKSSRDRYILENQANYIYKNGKDYTWYVHTEILFKKMAKHRFSDYNAKGYSICIDNKDTVKFRSNYDFFLVEILDNRTRGSW